MTNKQSQSHAAPEEKEKEKQNQELLFRRFKLMDDIVDSVRKANINAGLDSKVMNSFIDRPEPFKKKKYQLWISAVTNPKKPGKFWQISDLKAADLIPEEEENEHEGKTYPYRRLNSLMKVKTSDGKLFLQRHEMWYGLTKAGQELSISVNDLDYIVKPKV